LRFPLVPAALAALSLLATPANATTARDLSARMRVDGYTNDFAADEKVFGTDPRSGLPQESSTDSPWANNDLTQIRVTWDAQYLYVAVEGKIWGNNAILLIDAVPGRGLEDMTNLNSWRRNITFDPYGRFPGDEFLPDLFGATWDTNLNPRLITMLGGTFDPGCQCTHSNQVDDRQVGPDFRAAASFDQGNDGRAMELAIPWRNVFAGIAGIGTRDTVVGNDQGGVDTLRRMPLGVHSIKLCAVLTGGWDGSGGPDTAPDNLRGTSNDGNANLVVDNYAIIDLDRNDDTGLGRGGPDGIPDWNVSPSSRVSFRYAPPVTPVRFFLDGLTFDRPAFRPDLGERVHFGVRLRPALNPNDPLDQARRVTLSAGVYDVKGRWVRNLFVNWNTTAYDVDTRLASEGKGVWDGRDEQGRLVPPGVYVVRTTIETNLDRATRAVVVVR
jgi:hypothetical protein